MKPDKTIAIVIGEGQYLKFNRYDNKLEISIDDKILTTETVDELLAQKFAWLFEELPEQRQHYGRGSLGK